MYLSQLINIRRLILVVRVRYEFQVFAMGPERFTMS